MADESTVTINILAKDLASGVVNDVKTSFAGLANEAKSLLQSQLTQALSLGALFVGLKKAFTATDELEQSQRTLAAASQITGTNLTELYGIANQLHDAFKLDDATANQFTETITRLTTSAGMFGVTQEAANAFLELGAARGLTVTQTMDKLNLAFVGVFRGAQQLIGTHLEDLFKRQAAAMGLTVAELSQSEKAHILLTAALEAGETARGSYAKWLETAAGQTQIMNQQINEAQIAFGNALRPVRLLAIEGFAFVAEKLRDFVGGLQLMAVDTREFFDKLAALGLRLHAWVFEQLADIQDAIKVYFPGLAKLLFSEDSASMRRLATYWKNQTDEIIQAAADEAAKKTADVVKRFNVPLGTVTPPVGPPKAIDITPDIRQVIEFNRQIERLKAEFRDGQKSAVDFAGGLDEIRTAAREALKTPGLSQEAWKGLQAVINSTTAEIHVVAAGFFALHDVMLQLEEAWNKLINVTIKWKLIMADAAKTTLVEFGNVVEQTFAALADHSQKAGAVLAKSMLLAIAAVVRGIGQMLLVQAGQWIAEGIANPALASIKFAAAAKAAAIAGLAFATAGLLGGEASNISTSSGGGGGPGGGGTAVIGSTAAQNTIQQEATLVIEGSFLDMNDPRQADALAKALEQLSGRRVTVVARG